MSAEEQYSHASRDPAWPPVLFWSARLRRRTTYTNAHPALLFPGPFKSPLSRRSPDWSPSQSQPRARRRVFVRTRKFARWALTPSGVTVRSGSAIRARLSFLRAASAAPGSDAPRCRDTHSHADDTHAPAQPHRSAACVTISWSVAVAPAEPPPKLPPIQRRARAPRRLYLQARKFGRVAITMQALCA